MDRSSMVFERDYDFPRVIVWDALIDADLVSGWLAEAMIDAEVGGEYRLRWSHRLGRMDTRGRIAVLEASARLDVETSRGRLVFQLDELEGGTRGTATRLRVTVDVGLEPGSAPVIKADWLTNLDQLEDLLRGHPVDWTNWDRDRRASWRQHLGEVENSTA